VKKDLQRSSRAARRTRLKQTLKIAGSTQDSDVLEIGCGAGFACQYLKGMYCSYTGIDYSGQLIEFAKAEHALENVNFMEVNFYDFHPEKTFDIIFLIGVLHHMTDIPSAVQSIYRLLKPGGSLIANEPQPSNPIIHLLRKIRTKVDRSYSEEQLELQEAELISFFKQAGFEKVVSVPQGFFSTPFAEVVIQPQFLSLPLSKLACFIDLFLEKSFKKLLKKMAWNIIVSGTKPK